jgi:hypothetical protein
MHVRCLMVSEFRGMRVFGMQSLPGASSCARAAFQVKLPKKMHICSFLKKLRLVDGWRADRYQDHGNCPSPSLNEARRSQANLLSIVVVKLFKGHARAASLLYWNFESPRRIEGSPLRDEVRFSLYIHGLLVKNTCFMLLNTLLLRWFENGGKKFNSSLLR